MKQAHETSAMKLRPHHILDILRGYGNDRTFQPHPYGHAVHTVAQQILSSPDILIQLVCGADAICQPCCHLQTNGQCDDVLQQLDPPISKQQYNDTLDMRLFEYFGISAGDVMPMRKFLEYVREHISGIEKICTHPKEDPQDRLNGIMRGLSKLGMPVNS